ncbi:hypothetical protein A8709_31105 [Paenibacillus pectinilyticus]|uniref:Capsule synthesis protein CapA domain-containing protein n=1 Tax=Paenibacillus pectinilyticus TaxID=512399 RepID=A0A1C0ZVZ4_9BACL|nr:CapA family protein [Paenibacillus pectinilyticus]OCT12284.1 hypothetical protein A8709_31105 [Paenibacillus pectinilyticus]
MQTRRLVGIVVSQLVIGFVLMGCDVAAKPDEVKPPNVTEIGGQSPKPQETSFATVTPPPSSTPTPTPAPAPVVTKVELVAIGDILIHNTVYQEAAQLDGTYNFKGMFKDVRELIRSADLAVANQESIIGGKELGLSSYPMFNSPHEVGDALQDSGISIVTTANNHAMDMGEKGIVSAAKYWDHIGMPYTGAFTSQEDRDRIRTITKNGITFSFLAYSYGTNGIPIPDGKSFLVNLLDEDLMKRDIEKAKGISDVVVVSPHWGIENQTTPTDTQKALSQKMADWGADIIIGTHPHVLQPMSWLLRADGKRSLVMYSLGNFLSAQDQLIELIGGIGQITVVKTLYLNQTSIELVEPAFIPTYNKNENYSHFEVLPFHALADIDKHVVQAEWDPIKRRMKKDMPELIIKE